MKKISATIILDSITYPDMVGHRVTTFLLTFPRFILSELNTHRMFSRNSASSRAIPFEKMIKMVQEDPFIPIAWQKDHKGMQGTKYFTGWREKVLRKGWIAASKGAVFFATKLNKLGVTKQLCNRLLEPFMWHTALVTATEWENFFELRCPKYTTPVMGEGFYARSWKELLDNHSNPENEKLIKDHKEDILFKLEHNKGQAEIHMMALAEAMWDAMNESTPKLLKAGEWHIPFGDRIDEQTIKDFNGLTNSFAKIKIATARCARTSYLTFDGETDYKKDIKLHDKLLLDRHESPFEHCLKAMTKMEYYLYFKGKTYISVGDKNYQEQANHYLPNRFGWCDNFRGFISYRHLIKIGGEI